MLVRYIIGAMVHPPGFEPGLGFRRPIKSRIPSAGLGTRMRFILV